MRHLGKSVAWTMIVLAVCIYICGSAIGQSASASTASPTENTVTEERVKLLIKNSMEDNEARLKNTLAFLDHTEQYIHNLLIGIFATVSFLFGLQIYNASKAKLEAKIIADKAKAEIEKIKCEVMAKISSLAQLQRSYISLSKMISDLDEPSIVHPVTETSEVIIKNFLKNIGQLDEENLLPYDLEVMADAHNYLVGARDLDDKIKDRHKAKAIDYYIKSIESINSQEIGSQTTKKLKGAIETDISPLNYKLKRKLANAYSAKHEYNVAINLYEQILISSCGDLEGTHVLLSWGDALKGNREYKRASEKYEESIKKSEEILKKRQLNSNERKIYIESYYQKANMLTEMGDYESANECYKDCIDKAEKYGQIAEWMYLSWGDVFRRCNDYDESKTINLKPADRYDKAVEYYSKELEEHKNNFEAYYRKGQAHIGMAVEKLKEGKSVESKDFFSKAFDEFKETIDDNKEYKNATYWAYFYFILSNLDNRKEEVKNYLVKVENSLNEKMNQLVELSKSRNASCDELHDLVICYSMKEDTRKALKILKKSIIKNPERARRLAKESNSIGFINIWKDTQYREEFIKEVNTELIPLEFLNFPDKES